MFNLTRSRLIVAKKLDKMAYQQAVCFRKGVKFQHSIVTLYIPWLLEKIEQNNNNIVFLNS